MLSSVLFPQPLGPMSDTTSPSATAKLTSLMAVTLCPPAGAKRIVTLRYSSRIILASQILRVLVAPGETPQYSRKTCGAVTCGSRHSDEPTIPERPNERSPDDVRTDRPD